MPGQHFKNDIVELGMGFIITDGFKPGISIFDPINVLRNLPDNSCEMFLLRIKDHFIPEFFDAGNEHIDPIVKVYEFSHRVITILFGGED